MAGLRQRAKVNKQYQKIWKLALPYLKSGHKKDFVLHTEGVVKAVEMIIRLGGKGEKSLLIPAAILHDAGWCMVSKKLQLSEKKNDRIKALKLHIEDSAEIAKKILLKVGYESKKINKIISIIKAHKFHNSREINKRILIDADALSDSFKIQFEGDLKYYKADRLSMCNFRKKNNKFYTKIAEKVFDEEIEKRLK